MIATWVFLLLASCLHITIALENPGSSAFKPTEISCYPATADCSSCGYGYQQCGENGCYNPNVGETCCSDMAMCAEGTYCVGGGYCCPNGVPMESCRPCTLTSTNATSTTSTFPYGSWTGSYITSTTSATASLTSMPSTSTNSTFTSYDYFPPLSEPTIPVTATPTNVSYVPPPMTSITRVTSHGERVILVWTVLGLVWAGYVGLLGLGNW